MKINNAYIQEYLRSKSLPILSKVFLGCSKIEKEITESFGCLHGAKNYFEDVSNSVVIVVGDGIYPRTGAVFALYTKAKVISIDPEMRTEESEFDIRVGEIDGLLCYKSKGEDCKIDCDGKNAIIVLPHSHCDMRAAIKIPENYKQLNILNMPCCVHPSYELFRNPAISYQDKEVWSGKNLIHIWSNYK